MLFWYRWWQPMGKRRSLDYNTVRALFVSSACASSSPIATSNPLPRTDLSRSRSIACDRLILRTRVYSLRHPRYVTSSLIGRLSVFADAVVYRRLDTRPICRDCPSRIPSRTGRIPLLEVQPRRITIAIGRSRCSGADRRGSPT